MTSTDLRTPAVLAIIAAVSAVIAWKMPNDSIGRYIMAVIALAFGVISAAGIATYLADHWSIFFKRVREAMAITPETEQVRYYATLQPHQSEALLRHGPAVVLIPGVAGADAFYQIGDEQIPAYFVWEFFDQSTDKHLYPVRRYGSDSIEQRWAIAMTDYITNKLKLAEPAHGNQPASWRYGKARAEGWFRLREA